MGKPISGALESGKASEAVYDASAIRVLRDDEVLERFEWARLGSLAAQYGRDERWIRRGIQACEHCGINPEYFITRYLAGDKTVPFREDVDAAFRELFLQTESASK